MTAPKVMPRIKYFCANKAKTIMGRIITTLIAASVLWVFGTGPIRGFATTLGLGIVTSMFTAIIGTRVVVNLIYGYRRVDKLAIGTVRA